MPWSQRNWRRPELCSELRTTNNIAFSGGGTAVHAPCRIEGLRESPEKYYLELHSVHTRFLILKRLTKTIWTERPESCIILKYSGVLLQKDVNINMM